MLNINELDHIYISEGVAAYSKKLASDGVFDRQVDFLLLGFAYAVQKELTPPDRIQRHDLIRAGAIEVDTRLAIEAIAGWYVERKGLTGFDDEKKLLDFVCRLGSEGVKVLQEEWSGKTKSQIELNILRLTEDRMGNNGS